MALTQLADALLTHHDALRARFSRGEDGRWVQSYVAPDPELAERSVTSVAFDNTDDASADSALQALIAQVQQVFVLSEPPLITLVQVDMPYLRRRHLLAVVHHLVIDAYSWRVMEEDLNRLYAAVTTGSQTKLPSPNDAGVARTRARQRCSRRIQNHGLVRQLVSGTHRTSPDVS